MQHQNTELYSCIASESWQFFKRVFYLKQMNCHHEVHWSGRRGNCLRFPLSSGPVCAYVITCKLWDHVGLFLFSSQVTASSSRATKSDEKKSNKSFEQKTKNIVHLKCVLKTKHSQRLQIFHLFSSYVYRYIFTVTERYEAFV